MYPPFWFSTLESKKAMLIFTGRKISKITISGSSVTSSELSHTISTLDSMACNMEGHVKLIDRLFIPSDLSIVFHICLRNRHQPNQMSCVSFESEYMVLQLATHTSVRKALTLSKVLPMYLLRSKCLIQSG